MISDNYNLCPELIVNKNIIPGARTIVFDRDGTINVDNGYTHKVSEFRFTSKFIDILETLRKFRGNICIITNQGGVSLGKFLQTDSREFTEYLISMLKKNGIVVNLVLSCYHHNQDNCDFRKPAPGMLHQIEGLVGADISDYLYVGNDSKDAAVAKDRNVRYLDVRTRDFFEKFEEWVSSQ